MKSTNLLSRTCIAMVLMTLATTTAIAQNQLIRTLKVADGTVNQTQSPDALIDMQSTSKGLLLPRIELTSTTAAAPLAAHARGMVVYNTATAGDVTPGFYYNDGSKWVRLSGGLASTALTSANTPAGTAIGEMAYNTNAASGLPIGPVYWDGATWKPIGADAAVGNEVTNATTNGGLLRSGAGTAADPYTLGLTAGTTNGQVYTWNGTTWAPATATNIYAADGTLAANRIVTQGANTLAFASTATTGTSHFTVDGTTFSVDAANNRVGIGTTTPASTLEVNGSATNTAAFNAGSGTSINFANSNLAYTTASAGAFSLSGMKNGGTYTLAVQGTTSGTASFTHTGLTFSSANNTATATGKQTIYTFMVMGSTCYFWMTPGF